MVTETLYTALVFLMTKLEEIKDNPIQDRPFVIALTEVLRYFRDNGELKKAFAQQVDRMKGTEVSPFYAGLLEAFFSKMKAEHPNFHQPDINEIMKELSSDAFIDGRIKEVLGD